MPEAAIINLWLRCVCAPKFAHMPWKLHGPMFLARTPKDSHCSCATARITVTKLSFLLREGCLKLAFFEVQSLLKGVAINLFQHVAQRALRKQLTHLRLEAETCAAAC